MVRTFETLTISDVIEINRRMIAEFGGLFFDYNDNLLEPGALEHALIEIESSLFGEELYPDIFQKAGLIAWRINIGHIFFDGNKRTSMEACRLFLEQNNYILKIDNELVEIALRIAKHEIGFDTFVEWLRIKTIIA
jgi:death on curing protein